MREARIQALLDTHRADVTRELLQGFCGDRQGAPGGCICRARNERCVGGVAVAAWTNAAFVADCSTEDIGICVGSPAAEPFMTLAVDF